MAPTLALPGFLRTGQFTHHLYRMQDALRRRRHRHNGLRKYMSSREYSKMLRNFVNKNAKFDF